MFLVFWGSSYVWASFIGYLVKYPVQAYSWWYLFEEYREIRDKPENPRNHEKSDSTIQNPPMRYTKPTEKYDHKSPTSKYLINSGKLTPITENSSQSCIDMIKIQKAPSTSLLPENNSTIQSSSSLSSSSIKKYEIPVHTRVSDSDFQNLLTPAQSDLSKSANLGSLSDISTVAPSTRTLQKSTFCGNEVKITIINNKTDTCDDIAEFDDNFQSLDSISPEFDIDTSTKNSTSNPIVARPSNYPRIELKVDFNDHENTQVHTLV